MSARSAVVEYRGKRVMLRDACALAGTDIDTAWRRIKRGHTVDVAINFTGRLDPSRKGGRRADSPTLCQAIGVQHGHHMQISARFDIETWEALRARARRERTSVAEQVRKLVEWGLEADDA